MKPVSSLAQWEKLSIWLGVSFMTIIPAGAGLYVILSQAYEDDIEKWAIGIVGTAVGFWLNQFSRLLGR